MIEDIQINCIELTIASILLNNYQCLNLTIYDVPNDVTEFLSL